MTAPKIAARTQGGTVEGYWVDDDLFYFLAERIEPSLGRMVSIPSIVNCKTQSVEELIPFQALPDLLSAHSARPIDLEALSSAQFDMPDRNSLAVSVGARDYLVEPRQRCVIEARASLEIPGLYSPDGHYACLIRGHNIWLHERHTRQERPLTTDGAPRHCYGQESETSLAAVSYRKCPTPVGIWSPDSQWFLTHRIDERCLPEMPLVEHSPPEGCRPVLHSYKYPTIGDPLPMATYVAIHIASGRVITFDGFKAPVLMFSPFFLRMAWFSGTGRAWFLRIDRYCKQADLICLDLARGTGRVVLSEEVASGYLDLNPLTGRTPNVRTLATTDEVIWYSERDGWGQLYLYDASTGALKNRITAGEWLVRDIVHVDEMERKVLFLAGGIEANVDPAHRSLCSVNLNGSGFEVLLAHDGDIFVPRTEPAGLDQSRSYRPSYASAGLSPRASWAVVQYANVERGNQTEILDRSWRGFEIATVVPGLDEVSPRLFTATAADGETQLHGVMFFPSDFDESRCYPLVDYIYPGPQVAHQPQLYRSMDSAQAQSLAELGFVTVMLDTRGTPIGSRTFHQVGYGSLLEPQLSDHASVVRELSERHPFIDGTRVGMFGFSGGGFATARALCDYGEIFKVGVAACGNYEPSLYTASWSDKYRGRASHETWTDQAVGAVAHKLKGKLLLISGDMDENVHISHTLSLVNALIRANKDFDLLIVPNEGHFLLTTSGYAQRRAWDYFVRNLLCETPPPDFEIKFEPHELARFKRTFWLEMRL